jgi:hypothetical protein
LQAAYDQFRLKNKGIGELTIVRVVLAARLSEIRLVILIAVCGKLRLVKRSYKRIRGLRVRTDDFSFSEDAVKECYVPTTGKEARAQTEEEHTPRVGGSIVVHVVTCWLIAVRCH